MLCYHQEPKQYCELPARSKELAMRTKIFELCKSPTAQCWLLSHAGTRITWRGGESALQSQVASWCWCWDLGASALMVSVTQQQIQKVRSCSAGRERVQSAGSDTVCKVESLLVNLAAGLAKICFTNTSYSPQLLLLR